MFRVTPKPLNAVYVIFASIGERFSMIQPMVFSQALERIVAPESIRVIHRSLSGMLPDVTHQLVGGHLFHSLGIDPAVALQKPEDDAFTGSAPASLAFPPAAEVRLVNFNFSLEFAGLEFRDVIGRFTQTLVDARNCLIIQSQVARHAISWLLLVESRNDRDLLAQLFERFLAVAFSAFHITPAGLAYIERTAKNTLSTSQKVGRTVENIVLTSNHKDILTPYGYESN